MAEGHRPRHLRAGDRQGGARRVPALTKLEGIIPALEPAHALAHVIKLAPTMGKDKIIVMNLCGRGDKDVFSVASTSGWTSEGRVPEFEIYRSKQNVTALGGEVARRP